jgi:predicted DNA-binding transcriptional regulator AlpA
MPDLKVHSPVRRCDPGDRPNTPPTTLSAANREAPQTPEPLVYTTADLVVVLRTSAATLHRMKAAGKLPRPIRWGGKLCWRVADVQAWVAAGMPDLKTWEVLHPPANAAGHKHR